VNTDSDDMKAADAARTEAALTAGLTSFGIAPAPALASVLLFRGITFLIPPIFGFFTLRWLRAKGYA